MRATDNDVQNLEEANQRFREETRRYRFRYRCESCAHLVRSLNACSLGYPNDTLVGPVRALQSDGNLTFCKYYELGEFVPSST